jgi:asparagine synthetase B (glutamine-hydrolysing)
MCGICGKLEFDLQARVSPALVKAMADTISHRGPDDEGYYVSGPIGLGFRRRSIIDLNTGHQHQTWLPDDLLIKADKITMANSIELRVPFLDHKVMEFAASLPANFKVHGFTTEYLAKKALSQRVPQEIINRKKTGFPVPI